MLCNIPQNNSSSCNISCGDALERPSLCPVYTQRFLAMPWLKVAPAVHAMHGISCDTNSAYSLPVVPKSGVPCRAKLRSQQEQQEGDGTVKHSMSGDILCSMTQQATPAAPAMLPADRIVKTCHCQPSMLTAFPAMACAQLEDCAAVAAATTASYHSRQLNLDARCKIMYNSVVTGASVTLIKHSCVLPMPCLAIAVARLATEKLSSMRSLGFSHA